jgi:hypothetical protein
MTGSPWRPWEKFTEREGRVVRKPEQVTPGSKTVPEPPPRPPAFSRRVTYGGTGTIHRTGTIDIVTDEHGVIKQVWFRCRELPFTVSRYDHDPGEFNPANEMFIEDITYLHAPPEED